MSLPNKLEVISALSAFVTSLTISPKIICGNCQTNNINLNTLLIFPYHLKALEYKLELYFVTLEIYCFLLNTRAPDSVKASTTLDVTSLDLHLS